MESIQHNTDKLAQQLFNERPIQYKRGTDIKFSCEGDKTEKKNPRRRNIINFSFEMNNIKFKLLNFNFLQNGCHFF